MLAKIFGKSEKKPSTSTTQIPKDKPDISQYAGRVLDFSSQYGSENSISYTVSNIANQPNIYPNYGDFTHACVLRNYGPWWSMCPSAWQSYKRTPQSFISEDFIELYFDQKVIPTKVEIYETYHPGAVIKILACETNVQNAEYNMKWHTLWSGQPEKFDKARIFSPPIIKCDFVTNIIRLELNSSLCGYYTELDAVKLTGKLSAESSCSSTEADGDLNYPVQCTSEVEVLLERLDISKSEKANIHQDHTPNGYFDLLPGEVIQVILSYLDTSSLCSVAMTCSLLSRHCYDPLQYTELNLQPYWMQIHDSVLDSLQSRCCHLQRLNMSWVGGHEQVSPQSFCNFIQMCSGDLTCLRLSCCNFMNNDALKMIIKSCKNLQELDLSSCSKIDNTGFLQIMKLEKLRKLKLYRTAVDIHSLVAIARSCSDLEHLNAGSCNGVNSFDDLAVELAQNCKNLKSLDLWRNRSISDDGIEALADQCTQLEELDIGWCSEVRSNSGCLVNLITRCKNLKKLFLTANRTVCDNDIDALSRNSIHLEQLDILGTREVSQGSIHRLLEKCPKLHFLDVSFCAAIDFAFVDACKKEFPHVNIKKSFQNVH